MRGHTRHSLWAQKCHDEIIARARSRPQKRLPGHERHHVTPRCLGGEDGETVLLTWREHFLVHWLLIKIHPEERRLKFILTRMAGGRVVGGKQLRSSWQHALAKSYAARFPAFAGLQHSESTRKRMSAAHQGKRLSVEHRQNLGKVNKGRKRSPETRQKMSDAQRNRKHKRRIEQTLRILSGPHWRPVL
jgi:hypothetical protein